MQVTHDSQKLAKLEHVTGAHMDNVKEVEDLMDEFFKEYETYGGEHARRRRILQKN